MPKRNLLLLLVSTAACLLAWVARDRGPHGRRFGEVLSAIERAYLDPVDQRGLFDAAMDGVFSRLDEHSAFIAREEQGELESRLDQEFGGVGLELAIDPRRGLLSVVAPVVGSPAWRAGMQPGDVVEAIDGVATTGLTLGEAVAHLRGTPGTTVLVRVRVSGTPTSASDTSVGEPASFREMTLVRESVRLESVLGDRRLPDGSWDWFLEGAPCVVFIRITSFGDRTVAELKAALAAIRSQGPPRGLILDLRGNPGGLLSAAVETCDLFLDDGTILSTVGRTAGDRRQAVGADVRLATRGAELEGVPMAVLVDGLTASAGEIVAACLQDNGRATVVGSRSFGKGTVQSIVPLADGDGLLKLTTAEYLRPGGGTLHRRPFDGDDATWGVLPDRGFEITPTRDTLETVRRWRRRRDAVSGDATASPFPAAIDPVLERAIAAVGAAATSSAAGVAVDLGGEKKAPGDADDATRARQ